MPNMVSVGISDHKVSVNHDDILITYSLGSCLGVTVYDSQNNIGGLIHCLLPLAKVDPEKARNKPEMFVETGLPLLLKKMFELGARKNNLIIKAAGCGAPLQSAKSMKVGERNFVVFRKILWKNGLLLKGRDIGGTKPRTMLLDMKTGETLIKSQGSEYKI
ncbi:MAG: chemotaxis protein CheD [Candidatus Muiribacterium halophilum]|uniref:Probable chemoreceptor glutamine deamidase CheD n=1 Tax=Muiribacterium halophilum TaxID=2053465 RepID=A0A2N5ZDD7_MUIH1|nr:MAG: chemotaxis protein CheD [Candidatus Muirbacterium halophilum]